ncbi:MAG: cysteine desulfurase family protein [Phycisphaerales bacterium]|nr:cysteine desulfurase family protein [Phycisphaerales bacterium]
MVYLDHNATTKPTPGVIEGVNHAMAELWGNPSSVHRFGQEAKHAVEVARAQTAKLLGAAGGGRGLVFTGTGSEAIGMGVRGVMAALAPTGRRVVVTSGVEHSAVRELCEQMEREEMVEVRTVGVDQDGVLLFDQLVAAMDDSVGVVSIQWVNNETGVVQDVGRIGALCREHGAVFHCDGTQWVGKMETRLDGDDPGLGSLIDVLTCSPHKYHGIKGVGVLWSRSGGGRRIRMVPMIPGNQELGRRGGTEGVPAIVGAGVAAEEAVAWLSMGEGERRRVGLLRDRLEGAIVTRCREGMGLDVGVNGLNAERVWSATNIGFGGLEAEALLLAMSERGLCASAGAACSSGSLEASAVLVAMGVEQRLAHGSVRLSLSRETTDAEVDEGIEIVCKAVEVVGRSMV